jgi:hypothetical protein
MNNLANDISNELSNIDNVLNNLEKYKEVKIKTNDFAKQIILFSENHSKLELQELVGMSKYEIEKLGNDLIGSYERISIDKNGKNEGWTSKCKLDSVSQKVKFNKQNHTIKNNLSSLLSEYPKHKFLLLTLTVKNCDVDNLKDTIKKLNDSFSDFMNDKRIKKWFNNKQNKFSGAIKSLHIKKSLDGSINPHLHVLLQVPASFLRSDNYLTKKDWADLWEKSVGEEYKPQIDVKIIKENEDEDEDVQVSKICTYLLFQPLDFETVLDDVKDALKIMKQLKSSNSFSSRGTLKKLLKSNKTKPKDKFEPVGKVMFNDSENEWS